MAENDDIKIMVFACWKWGYGGADMAGTIRAQYPTSLRTMLVPCTGRIDSDLVMRAFGRGADGVLIIGWYPKECDYETGNYFTYRLVEYLKEVLKVVGLEPERLRMGFCTSADGQKFQLTAIEFDKKIKKLGPNPLRRKAEVKKSAPKGKAKA